MTKWGNVQPSLDNSEHIGPDTTGDNIHAKKVVTYSWNSSTNEWERQSNRLSIKNYLVEEDYDYVVADPDFSQPTTLTYKLGGSSGTTVATITFTYSGSNIVSITKT